MARYQLTPQATADVKQIVGHVRRQSPQGARLVRSKLREAMKRIAEYPGAGHLRLDLTSQPLRFWNIYSYLIIYLPDRKPVQILRIVHASRDVRMILRGGGG